MYDLYLSTNVVQQAVIAQEKIIRKIADNGTCVIVGRAADYVLRDYPNVIRAKQIMEMHGDTIEDAYENIKRSDYARSSYYRSISGNKWGDPHNYNLCIDAEIGRELCASQIIEIYKSKK